MCLSAFVSNSLSLSLLLFTLQKYIQYSLHHQWCKNQKHYIPENSHLSPEKKATIFQIEKLIFHSKPSIFLGLASKNPAPSFFNHKKNPPFWRNDQTDPPFPRGRGPGYLPPEAEATQVGHLQGTRFDARERLARYKWRGYMSVSHPESHHPPGVCFRIPDPVRWWNAWEIRIHTQRIQGG